jgi:phage/plasmid-associated DNA primase
VEIYQGLARIINGKATGLPAFPEKYYVHQPAPGVLAVLKAIDLDDPGVVGFVPLSAVSQTLLKYAAAALKESEDYQLTAKDADLAVDYWSYETPAVKTPKMFLWPFEEGLCFARMPWRAEAGPTHTWEGMLARMTNAEAFIDWIGSLFVEDSSLQDYCWVYGGGNDGKGAINRFLHRVFGPAYRSKQPPRKDREGNWVSGLIGSRICVFPDCNNTSFVASGLFKSITGGDPVDAEPKFKDPFTVVLNAKYLFFSNERPSLSSERSDLRRIVYCEFSQPGEFDPDFEDKLWAEGGAFIHACITSYLSKYQSRKSIAASTNSDELAAWVLSLEDDFQAFFDEQFLLNHENYRTWEQIRNLPSNTIDELTVKPSHMERILSARFPRKYDKAQFRNWMERRFGIKHLKVRLDKDVKRFYLGCRLKPMPSGSHLKLAESPAILDHRFD